MTFVLIGLMTSYFNPMYVRESNVDVHLVELLRVDDMGKTLLFPSGMMESTKPHVELLK